MAMIYLDLSFQRTNYGAEAGWNWVPFVVAPMNGNVAIRYNSDRDVPPSNLICVD